MALRLVLLLGLAQFPVLDSADFKAATQKLALAATLRVHDSVRGVDGSGFVLGADERGTYVLTAAHLIESVEQLTVESFTAKSYPEPAETFVKMELIAKSDALRDLALLRLPPGKSLAGLQLAPQEHAVPKTPFACLIAGCASGKPPRVRIEEVSAAKRGKRDPGEEPVLFWVVASKQEPGQSGGPLLDRDGFVLGICSGNNKMEGFFCHLEEIRGFLKAQGMEWLGGAKKDAK